MIIECPYCTTRFRLDESRLSHPRAMLKCSRCNHIFPAPGTGPAARPPAATAPPEDVAEDETPGILAPAPPPPPAPRRTAATPARAPAQENLSFTFDRDGDDWTADAPAAMHVPDAPFELDHPAPKAQRPKTRFTRPTEAADDAPTMDQDDEVDEEDDEVEEDAVTRSGGIRIAPVLVFLILVVAGYFALMMALVGNPDWAQEIAQRMPFVGSGNKDRLLSRKVVLLKVQGGYERIKEGKDIFVVTGEASNHAAVPLSSVQVLARILDRSGRALDERVIFCGSSIPLKLLRDLSLGELSVIGRLKPPKNFLVRPGEKAEFMVVFTDLPTPVAEFTAQVVVAQRQA